MFYEDKNLENQPFDKSRNFNPKFYVKIQSQIVAGRLKI